MTRRLTYRGSGEWWKLSEAAAITILLLCSAGGLLSRINREEMTVQNSRMILVGMVESIYVASRY